MTRKKASKPKTLKKCTPPKKCTPERAQAAAEVLSAVWLDDSFELEHKIDQTDVFEDADGNPWVTVRMLVPQLDVDLWLDGEHRHQNKE